MVMTKLEAVKKFKWSLERAAEMLKIYIQVTESGCIDFVDDERGTLNEIWNALDIDFRNTLIEIDQAEEWEGFCEDYKKPQLKLV